MRTRKARRTRSRRRGGFKYTNPTGSNLNLRLYSKQVGGSCKEKHKELCKSSCRKICHYVEELPRKDFEYDMKYKISALQQTVDAMKIEHKRLIELVKAKMELTRPQPAPIYVPFTTGGGEWFDFDVAENKICVEECQKICDRSEKAICEKVTDIVHPTKGKTFYNFLLEQKARLEVEMNDMKRTLGIR